MDQDDEAWAEALQAAFGEDGLGTWTFHVAAGDWMTTVVQPPAVMTEWPTAHLEHLGRLDSE